jgi:signal transduction histidine kinase
MDLLILLFAVSLNVLLGLTVFVRNRESATNRLFFLLNLDVALWTIANYMSLHTVVDIPVIFWMRLVMFLAVPQAVLFFLLIHTFPKARISLDPRKAGGLYIAALIAMAATMSPYLFTGVAYQGDVASPVPGAGMLLFVPVAIGSVIAGIVTLIHKFRNAQGVEKVQLRFIFYGVVTMFLLMVTLNFVLVVFFRNLSFISSSSLYTFPFVGTFAYAIIRHRFLDIRFLVARTVMYIVVVFLIAVFYSVTVVGFGHALIGINVTGDQLFGLTLVTVVIAVSFPYVRRYIERVTDRVFFKSGYSIHDVLGELGKVLASSLRLEFITRGVLKKLKPVLKFENAGFVILSAGKVTDVISEGLDLSAVGTELKLSALEASGVTVFDDLDESDFKKVLRAKNIAVIIPLKTESGIIGYLVIGGKASGETYSQQDITLLEILAPEAAVAIQNSLSYEEIRKFNVRLQEEIEKATGDLRQANTQLKELDKLKDEFVSLASHELRTPMTAIRGSIATILEGYAGDIAPQAREFLTAAYNENDRLIRLVNNLLNISRIEAGRLTFNIDTLNMDGIINEVITNLERAAKEKDLYLVYERKGDVPQVRGDSDKVREVLINLIGNAIKFTHKGGLTVRSMRKDNMVITSVTDTGSGIAKADQDLLFKKFSQVQGNYAKTSGGTGLGLYISKQIVEGLGGNVWLDSTIGIGSTFYFSLPVADAR